MTKKLHRLLTTAACVLPVVLVLGNIAQLGYAVICIGSDDHTELESFFEACCLDRASEAQMDDAGSAAAARGCGSCIDVQLEAPPFEAKRDESTSPALTALRLPLGAVCSCGCGSFSACHAQRPGSPNREPSEPLDSLSSVVLLT